MELDQLTKVEYVKLGDAKKYVELKKQHYGNNLNKIRENEKTEDI